MSSRVKIALTICASTISLTISSQAYAQAQTDCSTLSDPADRAKCVEGAAAPTVRNDVAVSTSADDAIVVTGSRIRRTDQETNGPVIMLDSKAIESRGFATLGQALSEQPAFGIADSSPVGTQSSMGPGQSFVNFFGLGSQRTLTLVNSRRFVGSNTSTIFGPTGSGGDQVDLNLIPTKLIDRTEIVAIGGAPIYGSDAIAGTVNVILKKDYEGIEIDGQYKISDRGDAPDYRIRLLAGTNFGGGRGNITVAGEYNEARGLLYRDRELPGLGRYYDARTTPDYPYRQQLYNERRLPGVGENGIPIVGRIGYDFLGLNAIFAPRYQTQYGAYLPMLGLPVGPFNLGVTGGGPATQAMRFDAFGNLVATDWGTPTSITNSSGGNGFSLTDLSNLLTNARRYSAIVQANYELTDNINMFFEGWYSHSEGTNLRDQPEYNSGLFGEPGDLANAGAYQISLANPFLSPAARAMILDSINNNPLSDQNQGYVGAQDYFYLDRANTDLVTGRVKGKVDTFRAVLGFNGDFEVFGDKTWRWEIFGNYGRSKTKSVQPVLNTQNLANAVDAIGTDPANASCRPGVVNSTGPTISSVCAPLNLFGNGVASQAARDYVTMLATPTSINEQYDFAASLTGPLIELPGGDLSFAIGYEHRKEHTKFDPSAAFRGYEDPANPGFYLSYGQSVAMAPIDAGYNTDEIFGELSAELIGPSNNIPMVHSLSVQLAGRYVDNSFTGGAFTWTAGGEWSPIRDIRIRGNYTHSIRSPSITEFANPAQSSFGFADDPCDPTEIDQGPNPTGRAANCLAAFQALGLTAADLAAFDALSDDRSFRQATAGDTNLKNETANSWTIGAVIQPRFMRGFHASVDYTTIKVDGAIRSFNGDDVLRGCYDSTEYPDNPYCGNVTRDDQGQISYLVTGYINADTLQYRGILADAGYRFNTPFLGNESSMALSVSYQHLIELSTTSAGTKTRTDGIGGYSKDKFVATLNYSDPEFDAMVQAAYIGPAKVNNYFAEDYQINHYDAVVFTNAGISYKVPNTGFQFRFNVDNVFDTKPPFPSTGASDVYFRGTLGRTYLFGASAKF